jgi:hypothetical protein
MILHIFEDIKKNMVYIFGIFHVYNDDFISEIIIL